MYAVTLWSCCFRDGDEQRPAQLLEVTRIHDHLELHPGVRLIVAPVVEAMPGSRITFSIPGTQLIEQTRNPPRCAPPCPAESRSPDVMRVGAFDVDRHGGTPVLATTSTHLRVGETTGVVDDHGTRRRRRPPPASRCRWKRDDPRRPGPRRRESPGRSRPRPQWWGSRNGRTARRRR